MPPVGDSPTPPPSGERTRVLAWLRRAAALAVLAWAANMVLRVGVSVCRDALAEAEVVRVCEPLAIASPQVLLVAVVVGLLFAPDLSELELGGLVTLKRRVEKAEAEVAQARADVALTRAELTAQIATTSTASAQQLTYFDYRRTAGVAEALTSIPPRSGRSGDPEQAATTAFLAGLVGLESHIMVPPEVDVSIVGFTRAGDRGGRVEATHFSSAPHDTELHQFASAVVADQWPITTTSVAVRDDGWVVIAPVHDDDGSLLGAFAAILHPADRLAAVDEVELAASVEPAAQAYARMLIDLLGETDRGQRGRGAAQ